MAITRERILQTLLNHPQATISNLAEAVNINSISVRHHITYLLADGSIIAEEVRHGVGRPRLVYSLSEKGLEHFPTRYLRLTNRLLDQLKNSLPEAQVQSLFSRMAKDMASDYAQKVKGLSIEQRLEFIKKLLSEEGFSLEWEKQGNTYHIKEITCPYYHVGKAHPEICAIDQTLISTILEIPAEKIQCLLNGDKQCTYKIPDIVAKDTV
jgi:predicted ArsR family transcriptional regulator